MKISTLAAAATLGLTIPALASVPATAAPKTPATVLRHSDLDLNDPRDAQTMLRRIHRAAVAVCRASPGMEGNDIGTIERFDSCYRQSVERAVAQLGASRVTAAYDATPGAKRVAGLR